MRVAFGAFEFDSGRRVLLSRGRAIPLSTKAFELLELLLDRRPEAVPKAELIEHLWPGTFVSDASLHNLVAEIRAAVADTPAMARYIRTVPRYGYAFHGDARPLPGMSTSAGPHWKARLVAGPREWLLSEGSNTVGRDRDCQVRIDSATLSRHHALIVLTGEAARIEDLGSKNGTRVNGQPLERSASLEDGDEIQLGSVTMSYRMLEPLPSTLKTGI